MLEMGGYSNEADFDQLELPAYQRCYLNAGPFPTAEGQVTIQAGSASAAARSINWTNSLRTHDWVREEWAQRLRPRGRSTAPTTTATSTPCWSARRPTTTAAT